MAIRLKRIYEDAAPDDGARILVDRLWPRGVSKERACLDLWLKDIAPSTELRRWFGHDPARWPDFKKRYTAELEKAELEKNDGPVHILRQKLKDGDVTLLYAARDQQRNEAVVLKHFLTH